MTAEQCRIEAEHGPRNTSEDWVGHAVWEVAAQLADLNDMLTNITRRIPQADGKREVLLNPWKRQ